LTLDAPRSYNARVEREELPPELGDQDRVLVVFGYLGPLALVSLVASRREFVKWHAKQGLVLSVTLALSYLVFSLVRFVIDRWLPAPIGELFWICVWMVLAGALVAMLVCIVRGLEGERFKIPLLGELADKL
jgi:uncharacterized membrane protein